MRDRVRIFTERHRGNVQQPARGKVAGPLGPRVFVAIGSEEIDVVEGQLIIQEVEALPGVVV